MIQDLEGATPEPTRRRHVLALSSAVAAVSLALLVAVIVPPSRDVAAPVAASPAPSPTASLALTIVGSPLNQIRLDLTRASVCTDGTRLTPPYWLAVDAGSRRVVGLQFDARTGRSIPVAVVIDARTFPATVTCDTFAPRGDLNTIAR